MKTKLLTAAFFAITASAIIFYPMQRSNALPNSPPVLPINPVAANKPLVDVVFVLDTTGSMGGLIQAAKEKIWSIASTLSSAQPAPEIRIGLVAYRDRGDDYVTQVVDLSSDLDSVYAKLMDFEADGGGDGPESVNQALNDAVNRISWSQNPQSYKAIFLVGDAEPHMDYQDDVKYPVSIAAAKGKGIVINAIQCGDVSETTRPWRQIAQLAGGEYFKVEQSGSAIAIATPFDAKIANLSKELDETRLYYGDKKQRAEKQAKQKATEKLHATASPESRARRAAFNATASGRENLLGDHELVDDIASGKVDLGSIAKDHLPEPIQAMAPAEQKALIEKSALKRQKLSSEIDALAQQRQDYLKNELEEKGGAKESLDQKVFDAVRAQTGKLGMSYEDGPAY